jgi:hypothetical protein
VPLSKEAVSEMSERPHIEDPQVLDDKLREILITGSLYRGFVYTGRGCHFAMNYGGQSSRYGALPKQLRMYCDHDKCKAETWWDVNNKNSYFSGQIQQFYYTCRNCGASIQYYQLVWQEKEHFSIFVKVGQWPPLTIAPSPDLAKALGPEDAMLYKKGLIDFNFGHGIGAVGYFRRVLENKINALLDLIAEAARNADLASEHLARIEAVKESHRVEDKIDIASKILPAHLKPGGHNPLDKLYGPLSAGLHGESDEECLTIFSEARFVFEYLFKNLTESNEEARKYVLRLSAPPKVKETAK